MSFLKAEWRKLAMINYSIDPELLRAYVPAGTELELWDGKCYVSVVGFLFENTRMKGWKIPGHINFEEVNLRFYVVKKEGDLTKHGVVFIQEIVRKPAITWIANWIYKENYRTRRMRYSVEVSGNNLSVEYAWKYKGKWNSLRVTGDNQLIEICPNSEAEFISEHYWGFAKKSESSTIEYEVTHPRWQQYQVLSYDVNIDFASSYGSHFAVLNSLSPQSVFLAEGSEITVEPNTVISAQG